MLGHVQLAIHPDHQVPHHLIEDTETAIQLAQQLTRPLDELEDVGALSVSIDLVGQPAPTPILRLRDPALEPGHERLDFFVDRVHLLVADIRGDDVHELVLGWFFHGFSFWTDGHRRGKEAGRPGGAAGVSWREFTRARSAATLPAPIDRIRPSLRRLLPGSG